jgi:hypothetical protein
MVGETVTPDRNTHFGFNDIPAAYRKLKYPAMLHSIYLLLAGLAGDVAEKDYLT